MQGAGQAELAISGLEILELGLASYSQVWTLQKERQRALMEGHGGEVLIVCEHPPVVTLGRSSKPDSLLLDASALAARGVELYEVERELADRFAAEDDAGRQRIGPRRRPRCAKSSTPGSSRNGCGRCRSLR